MSLNSCSPWLPLFDDSNDRVLLYHTHSGAVRNAPWISLRTPAGRVYFVNLVTSQVRWLPPHLWMQSWVSRSHVTEDYYGRKVIVTPFVDTPHHTRTLLPPDLAHKSVDGGACYMDAQHVPECFVMQSKGEE